jgi:hypothetical protein
MTRWGIVLLVVFFVIGLRPIESHRAVRSVVCVAAVVLAFVFIKGHAL